MNKGTSRMRENLAVNISSIPPFLRVLHIDDDPDQLMFTKLFLERSGPEIKVISVSEPEAVIKIIEHEKYDCIVLDYQMDAIDGVTLTRWVRKISNIPIIIYTGRGSDEVADFARAAGANAYVQKEVDPNHYKVLHNQIIQVINRHQSKDFPNNYIT